MSRAPATPRVAGPPTVISAHIEPAPTICVDIRRAAEILGGVSVWTIRAWIANGDLPTIKLPSVRRSGTTNRRILIAVADLAEFVRKHREVAGV